MLSEEELRTELVNLRLKIFEQMKINKIYSMCKLSSKIKNNYYNVNNFYNLAKK